MIPPISCSHQTSISWRVEIDDDDVERPGEDEEEAEDRGQRQERVARMDERDDADDDEDERQHAVQQLPPAGGDEHHPDLGTPATMATKPNRIEIDDTDV